MSLSPSQPPRAPRRCGFRAAPAETAPAPLRVAPAIAQPQAPRAPARPAPPAQATRPPSGEAGEEALRTVMALADLLVEKGYFTRSELMRALRK